MQYPQTKPDRIYSKMLWLKQKKLSIWLDNGIVYVVLIVMIKFVQLKLIRQSSDTLRTLTKGRKEKMIKVLQTLQKKKVPVKWESIHPLAQVLFLMVLQRKKKKMKIKF